MIPSCLLNKPDTFVVGGAIRDRLLGRSYSDIDVVVPHDAETCAKLVAQETNGTAFALDSERGIHRVRLEKGQTIDIAVRQGKNMDADLDRRDFSVNAMAVPIRAWVGRRWKAEIIDRHNGLRDLAARRIRPVSPRIWGDDPLRLLRAYRMAAELGFSLSSQTQAAIRLHRKKIRRPAPERKRDEMLRLLRVADSHRVLILMDQSGLLDDVFPEAQRLRKTATRHYGKGGVLKHTLDSIFCFESVLRDPSWFRGFRQKIQVYLDEPFAGHSRLAHCKWGILLHDIGKPDTMSYDATGRLRFFEHEFVGARRVPALAKKFRWSGEESARYASYIRNHMRPGNLAAQETVTDRAIHRFFRDLGDDAVAMLLISLGDHLSYLTPAQRKRRCSPHERLTIQMIRRYYTQRETILPPRLITGHDVMTCLKMGPSPLIGALLNDVQEAQSDGSISTKEEALAYLKQRLPWHQKNSPNNAS